MSWKKLIIVISLLLISACAEKSSMDESTGGEAQVEQEPVDTELVEEGLVDSNLVNREWFLNALDGEPLIEGTNIILAFTEKSYSGFAGCNGYGGPIEKGKVGEIKFGEMSSQAEGCIEPEGVLDQEINYLRQLKRMKIYLVEDGVLTLSNRGNGKSLMYTLREPLKMDPESLENSQWNLLVSDDFPLIEGSEITLAFSGGEMLGFAGCRDYKGEYEAEGDKIRFPMTMMLGEVCDDQALLIQEGKFTTAFELATHYQVQDDQLTLFLATGETLEFERIK
jgi:heat shock protein HslJ